MSNFRSYTPLLMAYVGGGMSGLYIAGGKEVSELMNIGGVLLWVAAGIAYGYVLNNYTKTQP